MQKVVKINVEPSSSDIPLNKVRFVCMSDTHSLTAHIKFDIPHGDVFLHAGDFTQFGQVHEVIEFNNWIGNLPHKYKIVIAGNHEISFDSTLNETRKRITRSSDIKKRLTNCIYLEENSIEVYGIKIYGTPWTPEYGPWAFGLARGQRCLEKWNLIPSNTDILVSHGPPVGHGDLCSNGDRAGCVELLSTIQQRVKPKYHVFGHIHEGYGVTSDGRITYINASTCNIDYKPINPPIVFDYDYQ